MPIEIHPENGTIPFDRIAPDDMLTIIKISQRAKEWAQDFKRRNGRDDLIDPEPMLVAMDIATTHLARDLNLFQFLVCNDLDFVADFVAITKNVDRACGTFPADVYLRCARWK